MEKVFFRGAFYAAGQFRERGKMAQKMVERSHFYVTVGQTICNMQESKKYSHEEIVAVMPQQDPFLFLDCAEISAGNVVGQYKIKGDEFFLKGHFKGNPVFPGTLMLEMLGQVCVFYLLKGGDQSLARDVDPMKVFVTCSEMLRCSRICRPGDTMVVRAKVVKIRHPLAYFEAVMDVDGERAAYAERISFAFDYAG